MIQRSFAGGELGQELYARADQAKYQTGTRTCRNFRVMRHGGIENRPGSALVNEVKDSSVITYGIKFVYNAEQTYLIEVGNLYMRFYREGARIIVSGVTAWSAATNYVVGDLASRLGVNYYCILAHINQQPPNATYWYPLDGVIYEIPTPYVTADIAKIQFQQSADVITLEHPNYPPKELTRLAHTTWKLETITFAPSISAPTGVSNSAVGAGATSWVVTAVKTESYEESLQSTATTSASVPTSGAPISVTWSLVTGAQEYNIYKIINGVYGYIGVAIGTAFSDNGITPNVTLTPPIARNPFNATNDYPSTGGYFQQRRLFANTNNNVEKFWGTRSGMTKNLTISSPLQDDDAVTFSVQGRQVNEIRHLFDLGVLVILTASGEWIVEGDQDGVLRANQPPNLKQIGYTGAAEIVPLIIANSLIYVQARGTIVRDLRNSVSEKSTVSTYEGRDLTVFSPHLFAGFSIDRWDYAQVPHSTAYAVRSDGVLLGLTYMREHEVWGWHRHDTDGTYEDVVCVPEGEEDSIYVFVNRTIDGATKRYIERFTTRMYTDIRYDAVFLDSYLSYDGRNTTATTLTLSTAGGWTVDDQITVTASGATFVPGDPGNAFHLLDADGNTIVSILVNDYTSATIVAGIPSKTVPVAAQGVATAVWGKAVDSLAGLDHLEDKDVAVFADGNVVASPNNPSYTTVTVAAGAVDLDRPYIVIHVGLPYISDFQTLDLDKNETDIRGRKKDLTHIKLLLKDSRGIFAGQQFPEEIDPVDRLDDTNALEGLDELTPTPITQYDGPWPVTSSLITMSVASTWEETGRFVVRQVDPLPLTIIAAIPSGEIGGG